MTNGRPSTEDSILWPDDETGVAGLIIILAVLLVLYLNRDALASFGPSADYVSRTLMDWRFFVR